MASSRTILPVVLPGGAAADLSATCEEASHISRREPQAAKVAPESHPKLSEINSLTTRWGV